MALLRNYVFAEIVFPHLWENFSFRRFSEVICFVVLNSHENIAVAGYMKWSLVQFQWLWFFKNVKWINAWRRSGNFAILLVLSTIEKFSSNVSRMKEYLVSASLRILLNVTKETWSAQEIDSIFPNIYVFFCLLNNRWINAFVFFLPWSLKLLPDLPDNHKLYLNHRNSVCYIIKVWILLNDYYILIRPHKELWPQSIFWIGGAKQTPKMQTLTIFPRTACMAYKGIFIPNSLQGNHHFTLAEGGSSVHVANSTNIITFSRCTRIQFTL